MKGNVFCAFFLLGLGCSALAAINCPDVFCFSSCPNGFVTGKDGCSSCSCLSTKEVQSRNCQDWQCIVSCDHGYKLDQRTRCLTCTCAPGSVIVPRSSSSSQQPSFIAPSQGGSSGGGSGGSQCNPIRCLIACPDGGDFLLDSQGCPTCECASPGSKSGAGDKDLGGEPKQTLVKEGAASGGEGKQAAAAASGGAGKGDASSGAGKGDASSGAGRTAGFPHWLGRMTNVLRHWFA